MEVLKTNAKDAVVEEKERRKAEKMALMMAKFDAVRFAFSLSRDVQKSNLQLMNERLLICTGGNPFRKLGRHPNHPREAQRFRPI
jgi:hypothetical protein